MNNAKVKVTVNGSTVLSAQWEDNATAKALLKKDALYDQDV